MTSDSSGSGNNSIVDPKVDHWSGPPKNIHIDNTDIARRGGGGGEPPMNEILERLVKVETKLENCASKSDIAEIRARLDNTATKHDVEKVNTDVAMTRADLADAKADIIKWMMGTLITVALASAGLLLGVARFMAAS
jgi:hypothetical protein